MSITKEAVIQALSQVEEPDLKKDLVTLNMIEDIKIEGKEVSFSVILTTPACPLKTLIENACINAIKHLVDKDAIVRVNMTSRVTSSGKAKTFGNVKNIVIVASGKGGVGKSTVAVNLALSLSKSGASVGLIDADIYGPSVPMMMQVEGAKPRATKREDGSMRLFPIEQYGIKLLSIGFFADPGQPIPWRGPMASTAVKQLFNDAEWGELDYLIVDMPPGTGDIHLSILQGYPIAGAVIVTTPQNVALADASKGMGMLRMGNINVPILGVVENMSYFVPKELPDNQYRIFGHGGGKVLAQMFEVPLLGEIPLVMGMADAGDSGEPVSLDASNPMAAAFMTLAEKVAQQLAIVNAGENVLA